MGWRKLHSEELNDLYSSPNNVRVLKIDNNEACGICSMYGGGERHIHSFSGEI